MRILLVGEYSGFHNALKYGLQSLGHEVTIVGDGDGFKKYPVDIDLDTGYFEMDWWRRKFRAGIWRFFKIDVKDYMTYSRFRESENLFKNHDIVQFINSNALNTSSAMEHKMIDFLIANNKKVTLVACGDDYEYAKYLTEEHTGYSILDPVKKGAVLPSKFYYTYKYLEDGYRANYEYIVQRALAVIPSNTDFHMPLTQQPKATAIIPAPVQTHLFENHINENLEIIEIFMGINRQNYWKKGINYFEEALKIIQSKYENRVNITIAEDLPYQEYITSYSKAHILLDQVLCYDQGYNALEAMAQGKVVFAGGSPLYLKAHGLSEIPVIDAQPDVDDLVAQLAQLIDHPEDILTLGNKARAHVLEYHDAVQIAGTYVEIYKG
jgi:glycosyltransferase involved in cell wall biosynthesis